MLIAGYGTASLMDQEAGLVQLVFSLRWGKWRQGNCFARHMHGNSPFVCNSVAAQALHREHYST